MAYRALYREFRPKLFRDVIGQSHITTVLQNQIATDHVAHAYLFCGSRGTGKTSTAKIFARALNCELPENGEPCGCCNSCRRSAKPDCPDIAELDAASNNGVDDVRSLIEKAQYTPLELKKRVFIVDEAHMITGAAFNALLKTLEEPPSHVVFVLATTEPQKIPATIISRCQRFDFRRLSAGDIESALINVLQQSGATADSEALSIISHAAEGSMRDALSLADQCLSFCGGHISGQDVNNILGSMGQDFLFGISDELIALRADSVLKMLDEIVRSGRTLPVFCQDLAAHFRSLLMVKTCGRCEDLLECTSELMNRYVRQAENASGPWLLSSLETLLRVRSELRYFSAPRIPLEAALVRICRPETKNTLIDLESRVVLLEDRLSVLSAGMASRPAPDNVPDPGRVPAPPRAEIRDVPAADSAGGGSASSGNAGTYSAPITEASPEPPVFDKDTLWNKVLLSCQRGNPFVYELVRTAVPQSLNGDTLTIGFTSETTYKTANTAYHLNKINRVLEEIRPGTSVSMILTGSKPVPDETESRLRDVFGDLLHIEN